MDGMIEEVVTSTPLTVRVFSPLARQLPDEVLASLEAVKAAQLAARERARRERWQAWAMVAGIATVATLGVSIVRPRLRAGRAASAAVTVAATAVAKSAAAAPAPVEQARTAGVSSPIGLLAAGVAELPAAKTAAPVPAAGLAGEAELGTCRDSYAGKRWRSAAEACAAAFASHPGDARLALRVAEAQYARDHLTEARDWAQRTLALDAKQADALAILAHSEQRSGDAEAAARAFRRYLALAPRGWHSAEARLALHAERGHVPGARAPRPAAPPSTAAGEPTDTSGDAPLRPTGEVTPSAPAAAPGGAE